MNDLYERWDIEEKIAKINIFIKSLKEPSSINIIDKDTIKYKTAKYYKNECGDVKRFVTDSDLEIIDNMNEILEYYNNQLK